MLLRSILGLERLAAIVGVLASLVLLAPVASAQPTDPAAQRELIQRVERMGEELVKLSGEFREVQKLAAGEAPTSALGRLDVFHGYVGVFVIAFVITLLATPIVRRLAVANGVIDRPSDPRKIHKIPIAYMGGVAVYLGIIFGLFYAILSVRFPGMVTWHASSRLIEGDHHSPVPYSVLLGITVIMFVGLIDDIVGVSPRVKVGGQLLAAAALAMEDFGTKVADGIVTPLGKLVGLQDLVWKIPLPFELPFYGSSVTFDLVYWSGTAIIAVFVIGACNASNLIDGLDGLLTGVTAIAVMGLLVIALTLAVWDDGPRDAQRVILSLAVLGACMGFLPHNFNPATIFLGDAGSLMLGFCTITLILSLGDTPGKTHLVVAGLIIYSIPIIDTVLAIVRRKMAGKSISSPDDQHLHHMLKRALGVKGAVLVLYAIGGTFALIGVALSLGKARVIYVLALLFISFIVVTAIKIARKKQIEDQAAAYDAARLAAAAAGNRAPETASDGAGASAGSPAARA